MTREYKFRGKRVDNGEWVHGYLFREEDGTTYIAQSFQWVDDYLFDIECHQVIPETVGQFTGLHDCNGKEIYEGDLLEVANHKRDKECIADVIFLDGAFWLHFPNEDLLNIKEVSECWVVIGNIHDNPELLKGGK